LAFRHYGEAAFLISEYQASGKRGWLFYRGTDDDLNSLGANVGVALAFLQAKSKQVRFFFEKKSLTPLKNKQNINFFFIEAMVLGQIDKYPYKSLSVF
jgi:hypothetical protein